MLWMTLLLALLLSLGALAYVLWPIVSQKMPAMPVENDELADLLARKDRALRSIKELEFDHQVGKISDEDFQRFNFRLSRQAIALIQQVEKLTPATNELDEALETEITKLRQVQAKRRVSTDATDDAITVNGTAKPAVVTSIPAAAGETAKSKARFCTECGTKLEPSFKFCANCGAPTVASVAQDTAS